MNVAEKHIRHFNRMNGNPVSKETLKKLLSEVTGVPGCEELKTVLNKAITKMNGHKGTDRLEFTPLKVPVVPRAKVKTTKAKVMPLPKADTVKKVESLPKPIEKPKAIIPAKAKPVNGFSSADQIPADGLKTFRWPTEIGEFLGDMQRYKLEIVIAGETHSSKTQLAMQIINAALEGGETVGLIDWEQGGLESKDTVQNINRNIRADLRKNLQVSGELPRTLEAVKSLDGKFSVVVLDSGSKLEQFTNSWIDELRKDCPKTIWIILMQQTAKGGTRGGTSAEFDAPIVIKTYRPDESDHRKNYAYLFKNRGNQTGLTYNIFKKEIEGHDVG